MHAAHQSLSGNTGEIGNWETGKTEPLVRQVPPVITFLRYAPFTFDGESLADELKRYRVTHGLTKKELAREIGIDPATLSRLERSIGKTFAFITEKLTAFMKSHYMEVDFLLQQANYLRKQKVER